MDIEKELDERASAKAAADEAAEEVETEIEEIEEPEKKPKVSKTALQDIEKLSSTLQKVREEHKKAERKAKDLEKRYNEAISELERFRSVDPDKYEQMVAEQQRLQEERLLARNRFEEAKQTYIQEAQKERERADKFRQELLDRTLNYQLERTFYNCGGKRSVSVGEDGTDIDDIAPVSAVSQILRPFLEINEAGNITVLDHLGNPVYNSEGKPMTLRERMDQLKKGHMGYFFNAENNASGSGAYPVTTTVDGRNVPVYSRDAARTGKLDAADIMAGRIALKN